MPAQVDQSFAGVKTEKIRKGKIWAGLRDTRRVFLEILPLHKSKDKPYKTKENIRKTEEQIIFTYFHGFSVF